MATTLDELLQQFLRERDPASLTRSHLEQVIYSLRDRDVRPVTCNTCPSRAYHLMHADLVRCLAMIEGAVATGLDESGAATRVDGRWSVAEIVEHLDRTYTGTTKGFERCLEAGVPRASAPTLKSRLRVFLVVTLGYFPTGVEAPAHVVPTGRVSLPDLLTKVRMHLETLDRTAAAAKARFGTGPMMDHPILGPFTVDQWLRFHRIHTRHHQKQIVERWRRLEAGP